MRSRPPVSDAQIDRWRLSAFRAVQTAAAGAVAAAARPAPADPSHLTKAIIVPLLREDPYVIEELRLNHQARAQIAEGLEYLGSLQGDLGSGQVKATLMANYGFVRGPWNRPDTPAMERSWHPSFDDDSLEILTGRVVPTEVAATLRAAISRRCVTGNLDEGKSRSRETVSQDVAANLAEHPEVAVILQRDEVARDVLAELVTRSASAQRKLSAAAPTVSEVLMESAQYRTTNQRHMADHDALGL